MSNLQSSEAATGWQELRVNLHKTLHNNVSIYNRHWFWYNGKGCRVQLGI